MKSKAHKSRKRRSRRPKFLSLRHQITADNQKPAAAAVEEKIEQESDVAGFFAAEEESAVTLDGILTPEKEDTAAATPSTAVEEEEGDDDGGTSLVRAALRSREREEGAVRWVRMSEVVREEEVSSCRAPEMGRSDGGGGGLALKLDYEEVVEAWCGGRPFFLGDQSEGPQTVPDVQLLHNDFFFCPPDLNAANGVLWGVPDHKCCIRNEKDENGDQAAEGWRVGQREASVLRYKEKRMNRLFSKRIRYEVRKLNAEKRPRVKGRFVKRS